MVTERPPYQQRVVVEFNELSNKLAKLTAFLQSATASNLGIRERTLLHRKAEAMSTYANVLSEQIHLFDEQRG